MKATQPDKLVKQDKQRIAEKKRITRLKNDYKKWEGSSSMKDLIDYLEAESSALMRDSKNRFMVIEGKIVPIDSGMVESLLYKSAGLDMARQYLKSKLK